MKRVLSGLIAGFLMFSGLAWGSIPQITAGGNSSFAIDSQGNLFAWGSDEFGVLGLGRGLSSAVPVLTLQGQQYEQISGGLNFAIGLKADGALWGWGINSKGQLGDGTTTNHSAPVRIGAGYSAVAVGYYHTVALKNDGSLWTWGGNSSGALGDGTLSKRATPMQIGTDYITIAAGPYTSMGIKTDGTLWAWGEGYGNTPVQIGTGYKAVVTSRYNTLGIKTDDSLWGWGSNSFGMLGDGTTTERSTPVQVGTGYQSVKMGNWHVVALKTDGTLWAWGSNSSGQFGIGSHVWYRDGVQKLVGSGYIDIAAGGNYTLAVKGDGSLLAWGADVMGQLGDNGEAEESCGGYTNNGVLYDLICRTTPVQIGSGFSSVVAGPSFDILNFAIKNDGTVFAWGDNNYGELGLSSNSHTAPEQIGSDYRAVATQTSWSGHSAAIKSDGTLWTWGDNDDGQLGDGTQTSRSVPTEIGIGYTQVAVGDGFTVALKTDGSLWSFGGYQFGELGIGEWQYFNDPPHLIPTFIGSGYRAISSGDSHTLAFKDDGSLWAWGHNYYGQLGDGTTQNRNSPVFIGYDFTSISAGFFHTMALKQDGSLWAWGHNYYGQLGDGTSENRSSPVQIPGNYASIAAGRYFSAALKADGSLWAWGNGSLSGLQLTLTPQQIATGFVAVAIGDNSILAGKSDGTLWALGGNSFGQLGDGTFAERRSPVLVADTNVAGYFNLNFGTTPDIPPESRVPFFVVANGEITDTSATVNTTTQFNAADVGQWGDVFVTAMVPSGSLDETLAATEKSQFRSMWSLFWDWLSIPKAYAEVLFELVQLTPEGWQPVTNGQLIPYATGVLGDQLAAQTILNGTDTTNLKGAEFCLGYGSNAEEMNEEGRMRTVATIPDLSGTTANTGSCLTIAPVTPIIVVTAPEMSYTVNGTHLSISWDSDPEATGYKLNYAVGAYTGPSDFFAMDLGTQTGFSYDSLVEGQTYTIAIQAYNDIGDSGYSNIETFTVPQPLVPPALSYTTNGLNLNITWSTVPDATGYTLYYAPYPYTGPDTIESVGMGNATSFNIDLWNGAAYYIAVRSNRGQESSDYSNIKSFVIGQQ